MNILGMGSIFSGGAGIENFEKALRRCWAEPGRTEAKWAPEGKSPAYLVDFDTVPDKALLKKVRRADKLSKMAVLAAAGALQDGGVERGGTGLGVIVATAFGAHVTTFGFLDNILDFGEAAVSPTVFSNSVHNAAASYVSSALDIKGPTLTITQFRFSFQAALQLALSWLEQRRCENVLVGAVDQYGDVLGYVSDRKLSVAQDGRIKPFGFKPTSCVPGEGALFLLLDREKSDNAYCAIRGLSMYDGNPAAGKPDLTIIDADGMLPDESAYLSCIEPDIPTTAYAPIFGTMMTGSAFNIAAGALMLKRQEVFGAPVQDNPRGLRILSETGTARIASIRCVGCDCYSEKSVVHLGGI